MKIVLVRPERICDLDRIVLKKIFIYYLHMYKSGGIIIKQSTVKVLDEKDTEFVDALRNLKVPRSVATLITFLANADEYEDRTCPPRTHLRPR